MGDTLNQYGYTFQIKVLTSLITDRKFISQIYDILDTNYFDSESLKWLAKKTLEYFNEYRLLPTLEVFKVQVSNLDKDSLLKSEVVSSLKEAFKNLESSDLEYIKKTTINFCRHQEIRKAYELSIEDFKKGNYDEIIRKLNTANQKGQDNQNIGLDYTLDVEKRYSETEQIKRISTGWQVIDDMMGGGLPIGKFGLIMGDKGSGKSFSLVHLGCAALKLGYDVIHYTLELDEDYVAYRYDACLTGYELDDLRYHVPDIKRRLEKYSNQLLIKEFPTKSVSLQGIKSHYEKTIMLGKKPKLVLIDYLDLLRIDGKKDSRKDEDLENLYEEFRGFCGEFQVAGWSVTQNNRTGSEKDVINADSVAGSYAKGFVADYWMSLSRRTKDKVKQTARWNIIKNRFGPDGMVLPSKFIPEKSLIEIYAEQSETGKKTQSDMQTDHEYEMKVGAKLFENIMNKNRTEDLF